MNMKLEPLDVHIRWLIRDDLRHVLTIERDEFEFPWSEDDFIRSLRERNIIGKVAVCRKTDAVTAFMLYELHKTRLHVLNFAVGWRYQRRGVGRRMVENLIDKLSHQRRRRILLEVRERNLAAQLFFKSCGFKAVSVLRNFYPEDTDESAYLFQYCHGQTDEFAGLNDTEQSAKPLAR